MNYRLVAIDLDGTLLKKDHSISPYNQEVIKALLDRGIHVLIATGRTFTAARRYHNQLALKTPMINCNGGFVYDPLTKDALFGHPISKNERLKIAKLFEDMDAFYMFYTDETIYAREMKYLVKKWHQENEDLEERDKVMIETHEDLVQLLEDLEAPIYKFLGIEEDELKWKGMYEKLAAEDEIEVVSSFKGAIDIMKKGITKGQALEKVAHHLKIPLEEVVAFGDNNNDATMLAAAGLGIAMDNATEVAKASANRFAPDHEEDGVGLVLNELFSLNIKRHAR